ncbi:transcriptional repressor AgaR [Enterovibrio coralii]|uniref:DeoR family transcriptional regulator n=1 Tax=Enterovibrio coralii TaxID=294935 RepID=A0A135I466_9GAMM|nr:transcriptional repressor AgaR [Enterovibrio coralii]KXF80240.1 DeoR family transcriptional regulator [Enterovibrio coralii]
MSTVERREQIVELARMNNTVKVEDLSLRFNVSTVTIRNDLNYLEKKGCIVRCYGGAMVNRHFAFDQPVQDKGRMFADIKSRIAAKAAELVRDGDAIILDSGSTTAKITRHLAEKNGLVVMTNSLNIAYDLASYDNIEVMVAGGTLRRQSFSLHGPAGEQLLKHYRFDKLFLGVDGFDLNAGITTPNEGEAHINRVMCDVAREVIAVTDASKFGRKSFCMIRHAGGIDKLITDSRIPNEYVQALTTMGVDVIIADQDN